MKKAITILAIVMAVFSLFTATLLVRGTWNYRRGLDACIALPEPTDINIEMTMAAHGFYQDALDTETPTAKEFILSNFK